MLLFLVSKAAISQLWQVFNDIGDGFGISLDECNEICSDLKEEMNISKLAITEKSTALFSILDSDHVRCIYAVDIFYVLIFLFVPFESN